jgi:hypothetical protein
MIEFSTISRLIWDKLTQISRKGEEVIIGTREIVKKKKTLNCLVDFVLQTLSLYDPFILLVFINIVYK